MPVQQLAALVPTPVRAAGTSRRGRSARRALTVASAHKEPKFHAKAKAAVGTMVGGLVATLPVRALSYDEMMAANQANAPNVKGLVKRSTAAPTPEAPSMPEMPELKMPEMPELKMPEMPKMPELKLPDAPPAVETVVPEVTNKLSASDMRAARIAARKAGGGAPAPEAVVPDVVPEVPQVVKSVKVPETTGKFEIPSEWLEATPKKVELPKVEVKVEPPKIEMPKLEMPKIQMPEVPEVPEVKVSGAPTSKFEIPAEWLEATPKKVEVPKVEPPKIEMPKLEMPKIEMPEVPETVVPEVTKKLSASEMRAARLAARQAEGGAAAPESVVPEVVKAVPKVPEAPTGKFEIPSEWLEATPKKVEVPKVEVPKVEVPKLEVPKVEVPKIEIPTPPKIDIPAPEADVPIPKAKVEIVMPDGFELPMAPKAATPQIPDVTLPEMKVELPKVELPKVELPTAAVSDALSGFKSQLGASADAAKQAASKAGGGLSQEFNKELGGAVDAVNKVKGAAADAVGNATSTVTSSVNAQADAISSSVGKSLSTGAAFVAQFLPAEIVELLSKATGDPDLAVAITATFVGTPVVALLLIKVVGSLGFAGTKTPQETEAALYAGNALLLDVRSVNELVSQGVPDLRGKARGKATVYGVKPLDAKVRGKVKSAGDVEVSIFAYGARALAKGRPVYLLSSGGGGQVKTLARALSKVGCKAYAVDGGMKGWAKAGLRTKDSYMVSVADVIKEEAEELAAPLLQSATGSSLKEAPPTELLKYGVIVAGAGVALYNYELLLEVIGIWGIVLTLAVRQANSEQGFGNLGGVGGEMKELLNNAVTTAQGTIGAANELAGTVSSKMIAPESEAVEKKK